eukprot:scaffold97858_cov45-Phaeocystis_antarctica.AAC.1
MPEGARPERTSGGRTTTRDGLRARTQNRLLGMLLGRTATSVAHAVTSSGTRSDDTSVGVFLP